VAVFGADLEQHTKVLERAVSDGTTQTGQTGQVYRSDRLSPGRPVAKPTNVAREGPVVAGARRVVLKS